jgi:hypothetical protein
MTLFFECILRCRIPASTYYEDNYNNLRLFCLCIFFEIQASALWNVAMS